MNLLSCLKIANKILLESDNNKSSVLYRMMSFDELEDIIENKVWHDFSLFSDDLYQAEAKAEREGTKLNPKNKFNDSKYKYFKSFSRQIAQYQLDNASSEMVIVKFSRKGLSSIPNTKLIDFIWYGEEDIEQEERLCSMTESININPNVIVGIELIEGTNYRNHMKLIRDCIDLVGMENIAKSVVKKAKDY